MSLSQQFTDTAFKLIETAGYGGLSVGLIVDSAGVPVPSEVLLPLAGALVRQGRFNMAAVIAVGTIAQSVGAFLAYWIGRKGGLPLIHRYGKYVFFSEHELAITQKWFARYGSRLTLVGRCLPVIRTYIGYPAGVAKMPVGGFITATLVGSLGWTTILTLLGYELAGQLDAIHHTLDRFSLVVVALLVVGAIWYVSRHRKQASKNS
ncbi:MAG TPA: DedA family protein [Candidatus Nanoarchaeia archaeon]|nr:DedA family protein [Candidatus Nanoarchaeia archaeon]